MADMKRRVSRTVKIGNTAIGGDFPISVQSMTNTDPHDFEATYAQVRCLCDVGCDIIRISAPDIDSCRVFCCHHYIGVCSAED